MTATLQEDDYLVSCGCMMAVFIGRTEQRDGETHCSHCGEKLARLKSTDDFFQPLSDDD